MKQLKNMYIFFSKMCLRNQRPETSSKSLEKKFRALKRRTLNATFNCIDFKG